MYPHQQELSRRKVSSLASTDSQVVQANVSSACQHKFANTPSQHKETSQAFRDVSTRVLDPQSVYLKLLGSHAAKSCGGKMYHHRVMLLHQPHLMHNHNQEPQSILKLYVPPPARAVKKKSFVFGQYRFTSCARKRVKCLPTQICKHSFSAQRNKPSIP